MSKEIEITELEMKHELGTKFYKVVLISRDSRQSVIIKRWGKVRTQGEHKVEKFASIRGADAEFQKITKAKKARGYSYEHSDIKENKVSAKHAREWLTRETSEETSQYVMEYVAGMVNIDSEVEIVSEEPVIAKAPDRSNDENWASW